MHELQTPTRRLVLKRFAFADAPALEWKRLQLAMEIEIPTPEPVALDEDGSWFGAPALLTSYIEGSTMHPPQPATLGALLAMIHAATPPDPMPQVLLRPARWNRWQPAADLPAVFNAGVAVRAEAPRDQVLSHCDFHPGNVLVDEHGRVTGVVDWANLRLAPRNFDISQARCDLAVDPGGDAPEVFLRAYEETSGSTIRRLAPWDVLAASRAYEQADAWLDSWTEAGMEMTANHIRATALAFAEAAASDVLGLPIDAVRPEPSGR